MVRIIITLFLTIIITTSCLQHQARKPVNSSKSSFLKESVERNKSIIKSQQLQFKRIIEKDSVLEYNVSGTGFWYAYIKTTKNRVFPKKGDLVRFSYEIKSLDGVLLYNETELDTVDYLVDKEDILPALREAVKLLSENEIASFLFPSYLCYGYQGDDEKVGVNQALRMTIKLISHSIEP